MVALDSLSASTLFLFILLAYCGGVQPLSQPDLTRNLWYRPAAREIAECETRSTMPQPLSNKITGSYAANSRNANFYQRRNLHLRAELRCIMLSRRRHTSRTLSDQTSRPLCSVAWLNRI